MHTRVHYVCQKNINRACCIMRLALHQYLALSSSCPETCMPIEILLIISASTEWQSHEICQFKLEEKHISYQLDNTFTSTCPVPVAPSCTQQFHNCPFVQIPTSLYLLVLGSFPNNRATTGVRATVGGNLTGDKALCAAYAIATVPTFSFVSLTLKPILASNPATSTPAYWLKMYCILQYTYYIQM